MTKKTLQSLCVYCGSFLFLLIQQRHAVDHLRARLDEPQSQERAPVAHVRSDPRVCPEELDLIAG